MTIYEIGVAYLQKEFILPITNDFILDVKKTIKEIDNGEILDEFRINDKMIALKIRLGSGAYGLFQLGALVQINRTFDSSLQKELDKLFPNN